MRRLLAGVKYDGGAHLLLDELGSRGRRREVWPLRNRTFTLQTLSTRSCVGYYDLAQFAWFPCPHDARPVEAASCTQCLRTTGFNPAFYHVPRTSLSPQQQRYNALPHAVYLAFFGRSFIKVGISARPRLLQRLTDQGARAALVAVMCEDAYEARHYEASIRDQFRLPEQMSMARKLVLLNERYDPRIARQELLSCRAAIYERFAEATRSDLFFDFSDEYFGGIGLDVPMVDLSDLEPPQISGRALGMAGQVLVMEQAGRHFMLSVKGMLGHEVLIEPEERPNARAPDAVQTGFDF